MDIQPSPSGGSFNEIEQKVVGAAENWFRQPSTITGLATIAGGLAMGLVQAVAHHGTYSAVAGAAVFALWHLVVNDNTASS